jgi:hypothetical protein
MDAHTSDQSSTTKGKGADVNGGGPAGFRPQHNMVAVVPPREEDLQKSYATIVGTGQLLSFKTARHAVQLNY